MYYCILLQLQTYQLIDLEAFEINFAQMPQGCLRDGKA